MLRYRGCGDGTPHQVLHPIEPQQRSFVQGEGRYKLDLSEITANRDSEHSLKISASDREIENIQSIVDKIKSEQEQVA